ncbi:hypothetical protein SUDANB9_02962 [Streptomyces sp. enrichment culture]
MGLRPSPRRGLRPLHPLRALPGTLVGLGPSPGRGFRPLHPLGLCPAAWRGVWSLHPFRGPARHPGGAPPQPPAGVSPPAPRRGFLPLHPLGLRPASRRGVWSLHPFRGLPGTLVGLYPSPRRGFRPPAPRRGFAPCTLLGCVRQPGGRFGPCTPSGALPGTLVGVSPQPPAGVGFRPLHPGGGFASCALSGCVRHPGGGFAPAPSRAVPGIPRGFLPCASSGRARHPGGFRYLHPFPRPHRGPEALCLLPPSGCALLGPAGAPPLRDLGLRSASRWEFRPLYPFAGLSRDPRRGFGPCRVSSGVRQEAGPPQRFRRPRAGSPRGLPPSPVASPGASGRWWPERREGRLVRVG